MKMNFSTISERLADTFGEREALVNIVEPQLGYVLRNLENNLQQVVQGRLMITTGQRAALATFCMVLPATLR